jgi:hypothetical protein
MTFCTITGAIDLGGMTSQTKIQSDLFCRLATREPKMKTQKSAGLDSVKIFIIGICFCQRFLGPNVSKTIGGALVNGLSASEIVLYLPLSKAKMRLKDACQF